ncbi:Tm-1-like ATP-binding domain-containing protein [Fulvivirga sedimenti]|uniref:Tm-1-like ATP-binding domain-containing protein n=1 Tax=Fulvivirga sedimenti TaxID=2879465 RepID=A0A9X1KYX6_9BACT|nr:Tm-1-like ATP-binding domain-containing protein [Fulvivirga sedimenti]MCA6078348.1 Tm-1-like ATP-binding domain-containing protein [Fulvivirga sedimenti]
MNKTIALLITLDTKEQEAAFLVDEIKKLGDLPLLMDIGVVGEPGTPPDITREEIALEGGKPIHELLKNPTREEASPVMVQGCIKILNRKIMSGEVDAVLGLGGTQGTSTCCNIMQALPYGFPKIMVSTIAAGDMSGFVGIKDITMMFSVSDILRLNPFTRKILANAAAAASGMAGVETKFLMEKGDKPLIGMTNLGVLTKGAIEAINYIEENGYEVIVFHAVGSGGRAMEQMMKEGIIGAVFDYAMGEIADDVWHVLRAGGPERLTVAGKLGIPQVLCPGGAEHLGILVEEHEIPEAFRDHKQVFHSPVIFVPRLNSEEMIRVADDILKRLQYTKNKAYFMFPLKGVGRYSIPGGVLHDPEADAAFFDHLRKNLPANIEVVEMDTHAEDPVFVKKAVDLLIELIEEN